MLSKYEDLPHKHYASMKAQHAMSNHARTLRRSQQHIPCPRTLSLTAICGYNWMAATTDRPWAVWDATRPCTRLISRLTFTHELLCQDTWRETMATLSNRVSDGSRR